MAFITDIEDALLTTLNNELDVPVIIAHENAPEPKGDYGVITYTTATRLHRTTNNFYKTDGGYKERIKQDFLVRFNVKFYGKSCHDKAFTSQAILASAQIQEDLYNLSYLSYGDVTDVQNNPEFRQTGFIDRAVYDVTFLTGYEHTRDVDWFDTVEYEATLEDGEGNILRQWQAYLNWHRTIDSILTWLQATETLYDTTNSLHLYL